MEGCNKPFIDAMREYDDGLGLTDYDFANHGFVGAPFDDDANKKKLAYRHRIIAQKYKKSSYVFIHYFDRRSAAIANFSLNKIHFGKIVVS